MADLSKYLERMHTNLKVLQEDISRIIVNKEKEEAEIKVSGKATSPKLSMKSLQRVTTLYKNEAELKEAQKEDPDILFIKNQTKIIFE